MAPRCRLCTSNDHGALVEGMAREAWEGAGYGRSWADAPEQWRKAFAAHAELMLRALEREHG